MAYEHELNRISVQSEFLSQMRNRALSAMRVARKREKDYESCSLHRASCSIHHRLHRDNAFLNRSLF
jgi:hypothetical protein